jgi:hypothetical protein
MQGRCELRDTGTNLGIEPGSFDYLSVISLCRTHCPRVLRRGPAADALAGIAGSNPAWGLVVCRECCVFDR